MSRSPVLAIACSVTLSTGLCAAAPPAPASPGYASVDTISADREEPSRFTSPGDVPELQKPPGLQAVDSDGAGQVKAVQAQIEQPATGLRAEQENRLNQTISNKATTSVTTAEASKSADACCRTEGGNEGCHSCSDGGCRKHDGFLSWMKHGFDHYGECDHPNKCHPCHVLFGGKHIECGMTTGNLIPHYPYPPAFHGYYYFRPYNIQNVREHRAIIHRLGGRRESPYSTEMFGPVYAANENTDYPEPSSPGSMEQLPRVTPRLPDLEELVK